MNLIREKIRPRSRGAKDIKGYLKEIEGDAQDLLRAAEQLDRPPVAQSVDVLLLLQALLRQVRTQRYDEIRSEKLQISIDAPADLPKVRAVRSSLGDCIQQCYYKWRGGDTKKGMWITHCEGMQVHGSHR